MRCIGQDECVIIGWAINHRKAGYIDPDGVIFIRDSDDIDLTTPGSQLCLVVGLYYVSGPLMRGAQLPATGYGEGIISSNGDGYVSFCRSGKEVWCRIDLTPILNMCNLKKEFRQLMKRVGILASGRAY